MAEEQSNVIRLIEKPSEYLYSSAFMVLTLPSGGVFCFDPDYFAGVMEEIQAKPKRRVVTIYTTNCEDTNVCETPEQVIKEFCRAYEVRRKME